MNINYQSWHLAEIWRSGSRGSNEVERRHVRRIEGTGSRSDGNTGRENEAGRGIFGDRSRDAQRRIRQCCRKRWGLVFVRRATAEVGVDAFLARWDAVPLAPGTRSVTPVGRLNNMVRQPSQQRRLPLTACLPDCLPASCVPRLTYRRLLPHGCCTHTYRLPARYLAPTNAVVRLVIPVATRFLVQRRSFASSEIPSLTREHKLPRTRQTHRVKWNFVGFWSDLRRECVSFVGIVQWH